MRCTCFLAVVFVSGAVLTAQLPAGEAAPAPAAVSSAITRAIPLLERGSAGSADQRTCFTCHNQALPILALAEARTRGFSIDTENLERQLEHTAAHLQRGRQSYLEGTGQGGKAITAGYALWALEAGDWQPDETTEAVTAYLLQYQQDKGHWEHRGKRPPSSGSDFTTTFVALRGLTAFGTEPQQPQIEARRQIVRAWLVREAPADTEDRVFRLRALREISADADELDAAIRDLLGRQREDGGWAQMEGLNSDAYATSTVLAALLQAGGIPPESPSIARGVQYLLDTQLEDGSWHVVTRAEPFQTYYESGFPHGADQFISITATSWAVLALLLTLPASS